MVTHLWLRTHELLYEEIGKITSEILLAWEKAEWGSFYFTLIQNNNFSYINVITHWKIEKLLFWIIIKICWEWLATSIERSPSSKFPLFHRNLYTDLSLVRIVKLETI